MACRATAAWVRWSRDRTPEKRDRFREELERMIEAFREAPERF